MRWRPRRLAREAPDLPKGVEITAFTFPAKLASLLKYAFAPAKEGHRPVT
jgi:hypothetical protein